MFLLYNFGNNIPMELHRMLSSVNCPIVSGLIGRNVFFNESGKYFPWNKLLRKYGDGICGEAAVVVMVCLCVCLAVLYGSE